MLDLNEIAERIREKMDKWELGTPFFADSRYHSVRLSVEHFHEFESSLNSAKTCYVDGGTLNLVNSPSVVIQLNRVGFCIYENNERVEPRNIRPSVNFFTVASTFRKGAEIYYAVELFPVDELARSFLPSEDDLVFHSFDQTLREGQRWASLNRAASSARVFSEWGLSTYLIQKELNERDVLIRDGSLQTQITGEANYANLAYGAALKKRVQVAGLAKTSTLYTDTGMPLFSAISILANQSKVNPPWFYAPIVDIQASDHRARMYAVKLHKDSKHVFRLEVLKDQPQYNDLSLIKGLAFNSQDLTFPGYPYGLIEADRVSRVRHEEVEPMRMQILSAITRKGVWDELEAFLKTVDAHEVLNEI